MIKVAINGFGRIGRLAFRAGIVADDIEIVAINAPDKTPAQLAYTVKYDSVHGRFQGTVEYDDNSITVNGKRVAVVGNRNPAELPWGEMGVEYVLECTGAFLTTEKAQAHLDAGAQVVVLSGPSKDDTPMFVCGVNLDKYTPDIKVVSNASCTTNCLAPVKAASEGPMKGVIEYCEDEVVSSDFITDPHTSIFDAKAGLALNDNFVKLMAWYDNEWGFSCKMLDLTRHIDKVRKA